jgi:hypothetical protein
MDRSIESGKSDALNKTSPTDQLVSIKWSKQLEKRSVAELEVIASNYYTTSGSFQKDYRPAHLQ